MSLIAKLNSKGVLQGFVKCPLEECVDKPGQVALPDLNSCDLEIGRYKWDAASRMFVPLGFGFGKPKAGPKISTEMLIYHTLAALEKSGISLDEPLAGWKSWFEKEIKPREEEL